MKKSSVLIGVVFFVLMIGGCSGIQKKLEKTTESKDEQLIQSFMEKGQKYENDGDLVEALKQYEFALARRPSKSDGYEEKPSN